MSWTDRDGTPVPVPDPPPAGSHYARIGALQGTSYGRNAFAMGTEQEVEVLLDVLAVGRGDRVLDVGCGNGRHVAAMQQRGISAVGVDLSADVMRSGPPGLVCARAQALPLGDATVDALISVCQGGFGVTPGDDAAAVAEWRRVLRPGGRVAATAFSLAFAARYMGPGEAIDVDAGMHHHVADVRGPDGAREDVDLWTTAYSVPHLRLLLGSAGFRVLGVAGVEPGAYQRDRPPRISDPEVLIWGHVHHNGAHGPDQ